MTAVDTRIAQTTAGRGLVSYDLAEEAVEAYGLSLREAHEAITSFLDDLTSDDGSLILARTPIRPELAQASAPDVDRDVWLTVSEETVNHIREALRATYGG